MPIDHCDVCRHRVPAGRWCNRCGARLTPIAGAPWRGGRGRWVAVVAGLCMALAGVALATVGWPAPSPGIEAADDGVVLDAPVSDPASAGGTVAGPVLVERPGGSPMPSPDPRAPRTEVVCSDLQVRAVPTAELSTTREGELVELAPGPCVVMGPEGATGSGR